MQRCELAVVHVWRTLGHPAQGRRLEGTYLIRQIVLYVFVRQAGGGPRGVTELSQTAERIVLECINGGAAANVGGSAIWSVPIANQPELVGITFHNQAVALDPAANPFGLSWSNSLDARVGAR